MKIKYGNNKNSRNNIQEKPHEHIVTWCLRKRKQITFKSRNFTDWKGFSIIWAKSCSAARPGRGVEGQQTPWGSLFNVVASLTENSYCSLTITPTTCGGSTRDAGSHPLPPLTLLHTQAWGSPREVT